MTVAMTMTNCAIGGSGGGGGQKCTKEQGVVNIDVVWCCVVTGIAIFKEWLVHGARHWQDELSAALVKVATSSLCVASRRSVPTVVLRGEDVVSLKRWRSKEATSKCCVVSSNSHTGVERRAWRYCSSLSCQGHGRYSKHWHSTCNIECTFVPSPQHHYHHHLATSLQLRAGTVH
ncbi:hypothetical protein E2C01_008811 [Portunus trituberculatus]|uniref:Uncharacterized protein n=1 Tax=Portunus trituberculatus TaxID=210409 RepID=A0A5B7D5L7_PORTR|nr:hypothetical protein [Portunus trituberculatus]